MYILILSVPYIISGFILFKGIKNKRKPLTAAGLIVAVLNSGFLWFMGFWGDKLWFDSLGFLDRFWTEFFAKLFTGSAAFLLGGIFMLLFLRSFGEVDKKVKSAFAGFTAVLAALIGAGLWEPALRFINRIDVGITDPILNMDASFYMFVLPFIQGVYQLLLTISVIALALSLAGLREGGIQFLKNGNTESPEVGSFKANNRPVLIASFIFLIILSAGRFLRRFQLLYSQGGVVSGPGWTDVYIRFPALTVAAVIGVVAAVALLIPGVRRLIARPLRKLTERILPGENNTPIRSVASSFGMVFLSWILILGIIPGLVQALLVAPNEITYEKPFIENNIKYTRYAFNLDSVREKEFSMESSDFNRSTVENNPALINNVRLWDWRALGSVYQQFQEIRLYYKFGDIDMDRYTIDEEKRAVLVAAREMDTSNLPEQSQNFVNKRFKYTHGYGIAMNTVNEFTESGLPHLLIKDIPPVNEKPELSVSRPELYYGEKANSYVIVNSSEEEFDYPQGDNNRYVSYEGSGGVRISNFFRKFIYGYKFNSTKLLFSGYPTKDSRIMLNRNISRRVKLAAPFLQFDEDPYIVMIDGELLWFIDAYTTSSTYPYSEHMSKSQGLNNYIRNSVKAVVNPYNGKIDLYVYDEDDPVIKVWDRIYPGLLKPKSEMPASYREHVRYPADYLLIQGEVYAKYHMTDPEVFYNQEDLWVRATEKYYSDVQPVEPYYIMWESPGSNKPEFIIMLPYTPKNKQVLIGWIAGMSDPENYGDFIAYKFPKEERVIGPQQVETKIDQDSFLSGQLSLWDQRGSNVIRGNMLALPIDGTLLYVEPIYLQSETSAYPELRMVVTMHKDRLSYAQTLSEALEGLYEEDSTAPALRTKAAAGEPDSRQLDLIRQADEAFNRYIEATGSGDFKTAGEALQNMRDLFNEISLE